MKFFISFFLLFISLTSILAVKRKEPSERSDSKYFSRIHSKKSNKQKALTQSKSTVRKANFSSLNLNKIKPSKRIERNIKKLIPIPEEPKPTFQEIIYKDEELVLQIRARSFKQGNLAFLKLYSHIPNFKPDFEKYKIFWRDKQIQPIPYKDYYMAMLPIHPENEVGIQYLDTVREYETKIVRKKFPIEIEKSHFLETKIFSVLRLPRVVRKLPQETIDFINKCDIKKKEVFGLFTENKMDGDFVKPLTKLMVTSPFYAKRHYNLLKSKPHGGVDFRGGVGEKIYAIQSGKVVIAQRMYYEGIFTVIDHGNNLFSLYMHQSKLHVKEGDVVKRGQLIGEVGSTGMSTGPHLHLGLRIDGILVNPLSVIDLNLF
ncbi:MAG: M23 family metallopeptidase [Leptospiraceae bacterium]|nr:M23 family metallopeptidase [Leptospiraceae bacterium]